MNRLTNCSVRQFLEGLGRLENTHGSTRNSKLARARIERKNLANILQTRNNSRKKLRQRCATRPSTTQRHSHQKRLSTDDSYNTRKCSPVRRLNIWPALESYRRTSGSPGRSTLGARSAVTYSSIINTAFATSGYRKYIAFQCVVI